MAKPILAITTFQAKHCLANILKSEEQTNGQTNEGEVTTMCLSPCTDKMYSIYCALKLEIWLLN